MNTTKPCCRLNNGPVAVLQVIVDELLSSLEVVNCHSVKVQVRNKVPTVAIDKTDGIVVILSKESMGVSFVTSKSSEM